MFSKETYIQRRQALKEAVGSGLIIILGNNESPANYPNNCYTFRQDSSFIYFFGAVRDGLAGVIDADNDKEYLLGDDIDIDDIVWYGSVDSVSDMAEMAGVKESAPFGKLSELVNAAQQSNQEIHFLPPYRHDNKILLQELLGIKPAEQKAAASVKLIKAIVNLRSTKSDEEIREIERACSIGFKMHTTAMKLAQPGVTEHFIGGTIDGIANSLGSKVSFASIVTMHGEILHGAPKMTHLEAGRLLLVDAGAETLNNYCSDHTRTTPVSGKFTHRQRDIYTIVEQAHDLAMQQAKPGVKYYDVHMDVCRLIVNGLKELELMCGDTEEAVQAGAHALFLPHGLGHMMGIDVHDMEDLGQNYVGYDDEIQPSTQFGTASLRMGRRLQKGFVITDEPGIYFIPDLIDYWKANNINSEFLNFANIEKYKDFGGIRIEDDLLITDDGARFLGKDVIPYHADDVEKYVAEFHY
ncbi:MAG: aminopeptidase P family protein [Bacteroidaceae bacterium]|nr:aminopeptidase P family protein [Bacteroidaceae bacterium]MBO4593962.1 aminopeptidase P family protein [Bacteroidaceae bacterium]